LEKEIVLGKKQVQEIESQMNVLYEYMKVTEDVIKPIDEIACQAINNIIAMAMVSLGRKYGLDYCDSQESKVDSKEEKAIDDIMKDIEERTKE